MSLLRQIPSECSRAKRGGFGRWERDADFKPWIIPVLIMGVITPILLISIWIYSEAREVAELNETEAETKNGVTDEWIDEQLAKKEESQSTRDKKLAAKLSSILDESPAKPTDQNQAGFLAETDEPKLTFQESLDRAESFLATNSLVQARETLERAVELPDFDPKQRTRYETLLGVISLRQGLPAEASSHFILAKSSSPANVTVTLNLAEAFRAAGMVRLTEATLLDALELSPEGFFPNVRYRYFLIEHGRRDQVVEEIRSVPEEERYQNDVLAVAAGLHANAGAYDKVMKVFSRLESQMDEKTLAVLVTDPIFRNMQPGSEP